MGEIISALIVGGLALVGTIITNISGNRRVERKLEVQAAVSDTKVEELTREVREHNNFARRMPVVEQEIKDLKSDIKQLKKYHTEKV